MQRCHRLQGRHIGYGVSQIDLGGGSGCVGRGPFWRLDLRCGVQRPRMLLHQVSGSTCSRTGPTSSPPATRWSRSTSPPASNPRRCASSTTAATSRARSPSGQRALRGPRHRSRRSARTSSPPALRARQRREHHGHRPSQRRPGLLRPAGPALGLPVERRRRPVQPARRPTSTSTSDATARSPPTTRRTRRPTSPTTTTDQGKTVPYIVRDRDRLPGPRPVQDRRPLRPDQAVGGRGSRSAVEPQAPDHPRRELRDRPPGRARRRTSDERRRAARAASP